MTQENSFSNEELEKINEVEIDADLQNKIKNRQENIFFKIQLRKILQEVEEDLEEEEYIEFYSMGINYSAQNVRHMLLTTIDYSWTTHPIFGWKTGCILICTNRRNLIVNTDIYSKSDIYMEIEKKICLKKDKKVFYLKVIQKGTDNKKKDIILQFNMNNYDLIRKYVSVNGDIQEVKRINDIMNIIKWIIPGLFSAYFIYIIFLIIKSMILG